MKTRSVVPAVTNGHYKKDHYKKGQYVVCRYRGKDNGDLVVGEVVSYRGSSGSVELRNMLTGARSLRAVEVLDRRNVRCTKQDADRVVAAFVTAAATGISHADAKAAAREQAVLISSQPPVSVKPVQSVAAVDAVVRSFRALSLDDQQRAGRQLWGDVLAAFGVA